MPDRPPARWNGRRMSDTTAIFFDELGRTGHDVRLEKLTGTMRFELTDGTRTDPWLVKIKKGDVSVSHESRKADCVVRADKSLFEGLVTGNRNALTSMLRGEMGTVGNVELLVVFQRLFPG